jgi:hypothetical protein
MTSKRSLQTATAILGAVPIITGIITMFGINNPIYAHVGIPQNTLLDSNLRFFGGMWLALGLAVYWLIPRIEQESVLFRILWLMIFIGGVGRLLSMFFVGMPPIPLIAFTILEIVGAPVFVVWQWSLSR